jgi:hypothetical protein
MSPAQMTAVQLGGLKFREKSLWFKSFPWRTNAIMSVMSLEAYVDEMKKGVSGEHAGWMKALSVSLLGFFFKWLIFGNSAFCSRLSLVNWTLSRVTFLNSPHYTLPDCMYWISLKSSCTKVK